MELSAAQIRNAQEIERLKQLGGGISHLSSKGTSINRGDWTDEHLFDIVNKIKIPHVDSASEKLVISRFFEFYLGGTVRADDQVCATIIDAILLLKTVKGKVFQTEAVNGEQWYTPNESKELWNPDFICHKFEGFDIPTFLDADTEAAYKALLGSPTVEDGRVFMQFITDSLDQYHKPAVGAVVRNLASCLALITLRSVAKDSVSVRNAFGKKQLRRNLSALINFDPALPLYPPAKSFVERSILAFSNGSSATRNIFAIIVKTFVEEDFKSDENLVIPALLGATVLTHTSRTGMGLVHMYTLAKEATGWSHDKLVTCSYIGATQQSWTRLTDFLAKNVGPDDQHQQYSWPWARIISDGHNRGLSSKENIGLCVTFAMCSEHISGKGIWTAEWSKDIGNYYDSFKKLGMAIRNASRVNDDDMREELHCDIQRYFQEASALVAAGRAAHQPVEHLSISDGETSDLDPADFE